MTAHLRALLSSAPGVVGAARLLRPDQLIAPAIAPTCWGLESMRGRLVELSGHGAAATLTAAVELVLEAQHAAEPVAWLCLAGSSFFPPDLADSGVDLGTLVVVRVGDPSAAARAAARLLQSGAFGLVVLDFAGGGTLDLPLARACEGVFSVEPSVSRGDRYPGDRMEYDLLPIAQQGRLVGLAQNHDAAVVCLTDKPVDIPSLSSLVSLRAEATRADDRDDAIRIDVRKDKQRGAGGVRLIELGG